MFSPQGFDLDVDELLAQFSSATIQRGLLYAEQGRVRTTKWRDDGLELTGRCSGSGSSGE